MLDIKTNKVEAEIEFQKWQKEYNSTYSKQASDMCFYYIYNAVKNSMLAQLSKRNGQYIKDIDDKALDAALDVLKKMKAGVEINKLSSFVYLYARGRLFDRKEQRRNANEVLFSDVNLDDNGEKGVKLC